METLLFAYPFLIRWSPVCNLLTRVEWSGTHTQEWDSENHLTRVTNSSNGQSATFVYDGDGRRVHKGETSSGSAYLGQHSEVKNGCQPVAWLNLVNVTANSNTLQKSSGGSDWNAGAASAQSIAAGDGYVEVVVDATNTYRMVGLSNGDANQSYVDIDFAIYPAADGGLYVYEAGAYRGYFGTYAVGDRLRVAVEKGVVRYYRNNVLLYTSSVAPTYPLLVDSSLYTPNAQVAQAILCAPQAVNWINLVNVTANGNTLQKTSGGWDWNAGAASSQSLASGDGYVEVVVDATNAYRMFGLSNGDSNAAYWDIDFALYPADGGGLYVYEGGTYRGYFGTYAVGDRLRVAVEGGVVRYYKNNALLYTSGTAPTYPLLVDTSLYTPNGQVAQAVVSSGFREWTKYYYAGSQRVALRNPTGVFYVHGDHLGSTTLSTTSGGALQSAQRYSAYGNIRTSSGAVPSDYRFTGQRRESGALGINVYDYGARFYSAFIGRFLSADTIVPGAGNPQALNRYSYSFNNPLRYVDPTGNTPEDNYVVVTACVPVGTPCKEDGDPSWPDFETWIRANIGGNIEDEKLWRAWYASHVKVIQVKKNDPAAVADAVSSFSGKGGKIYLLGTSAGGASIMDYLEQLQSSDSSVPAIAGAIVVQAPIGSNNRLPADYIGFHRYDAKGDRFGKDFIEWTSNRGISVLTVSYENDAISVKGKEWAGGVPYELSADPAHEPRSRIPYAGSHAYTSGAYGASRLFNFLWGLGWLR